jgi:hypothetical protein
VKEGYADLGTGYACPSEYVHPGDTSGASFSNWSDQDLFPGSIAEHLIISCDTSFYEWGSDFWFRYQNDQLGEDNEPLQKTCAPRASERPGRPAGRRAASCRTPSGEAQTAATCSVKAAGIGATSSMIGSVHVVTPRSSRPHARDRERRSPVPSSRRRSRDGERRRPK